MQQRQQRFVRAYLTSGKATQAAMVAGYRAKGAAVQGSRLLHQPQVKQAV